MITKHSFFQPEQVKEPHLSRPIQELTKSETMSGPSTEEQFLYVDIETTGLSRENTIIYMIGCGYPEEQGLHVVQWFNDDGSSEAEILRAFHELISQKEYTIITFNGESFDLPYLESHYLQNEISSPLSSHLSIDLYRILKPWQKLFSMKHGRQKDWEAFLGIGREDTKNGRELIKIYHHYLLHHKMKDLEKASCTPGHINAQETPTDDLYMLFLHNYEDICHLFLLTPLLALDSISQGYFQFEELQCLENEVVFTCSLESPLPVQIRAETRHGVLHLGRKPYTSDNTSYNISDYMLSAEEPTQGENPENAKAGFQLQLPVCTGNLKHFFPDAGNYYYLPQEDRAVHKSIGQYVDKEYRRKCTAAECYVKKEGIFLPLYKKKSSVGYRGEKDHKKVNKTEKTRIENLTLYRPEYRSKLQYIDYNELKAAGEEAIHEYIAASLKYLLC